MRSPFLSRLVTRLLLVSLLAGCQPAPVPDPAETSVTTPGRTQAAPTRTVRAAATQKTPLAPTVTPTHPPSKLAVDVADLEDIEVVFWHSAVGESETVLSLMVGEFNQSNEWDLRVKAVAYPGPGELEEALLQGQDEESLPDLLAAFGDQAQHWQASAGISLADLSAYVEDPAWGLTAAEQEDFYPVFWSPRRQEGGEGGSSAVETRLGVPWYRSGLVVLYNTTWAGELGFRSPPDTPDEFMQQACAAARLNRFDRVRTNDGTGGWVYTREPLALLGWIYAFGGDIWDEDIRDQGIPDEAGGGYNFDTPESEDALRFLKELSTESCAWDAGEEVPEQAFAERRALLWIGSLSSLVAQELALQQLPSDDEWEVLPFPSTSELPVIVTYGPDLVVVESDAERQLGAWLFARWLLSPQNQARWAEANGVFPVRKSALEQQLPSSSGLKQWRQALKWLPYAHQEPAYASWNTLRWALADAQDQLLSSGFASENIPELLQMLDELAEEIHALER